MDVHLCKEQTPYALRVLGLYNNDTHNIRVRISVFPIFSVFQMQYLDKPTVLPSLPRRPMLSLSIQSEAEWKAVLIQPTLSNRRNYLRVYEPH